MRIRTLFVLATTGASVVALLVLGSLWYAAERNTATFQAQNDSQEIARGVASLLTLTQEYTVYGGARASSQLRARYAQLVATVDGALARQAMPDPDLQEVRENVLDLLPLYDNLEQAFSAGASDLAQRRRELIVERLVSESQELVEARHR